MNKYEMDYLWNRLNILVKSENISSCELLELSFTLDKYIFEFIMEN